MEEDLYAFKTKKPEDKPEEKKDETPVVEQEAKHEFNPEVKPEEHSLENDVIEISEPK